MSGFDAIVVGGGLVGAAIAHGLTQAGLATVVLDEGDVAHRASRGNFGLVWVQSKGIGAPDYHRWSRASATVWPDLAAGLGEATGLDIGLRQPGGLSVCLSEAELALRGAGMDRLRGELGNTGLDYRLLTGTEAREMLPGLGPEVAGAVWSPYDGQANPLLLLRALHQAHVAAGGTYRPNAAVGRIAAAAHDFAVELDGTTLRAPLLVLAAGLGNAVLAPQVGLAAPVRPERGQILVTERTRGFLAMPTLTVRQTEEGSMMLGDSKEDAGFDTLTQTPAIMRDIAGRAVRMFPAIAALNIVRAWSALRVMAPDGLPIYAQSARFPGAFVATCHSGVTLAGAHARLLAPMLARGALEAELTAFDAGRFDVQGAA